MKVKGKDLKLLFQKSAASISRDWGELLQVSSKFPKFDYKLSETIGSLNNWITKKNSGKLSLDGLEVHYDTTSGVPKVTKIRIVRGDYGVPQIDDIEDDEEYYFVIPAFIREGRGLYNFESEIWKDLNDTTGCNDIYVVFAFAYVSIYLNYLQV